MDKSWRIIDVIKWSSDYFNKFNIESPRLLIELLISDVLQIPRFELYLNYDKPLTKLELSKLNAYIKKAVNNEPLQYILGYTDFMNLKFAVTSDVLIPRPETEELVQIVIDKISISNNINNIIDIGTGSGCIAVSLSNAFPDKNVYGLDISSKALAKAKENALLNKSNAKFKIMNILETIPDFKFDCIISNPPYISQNLYEKLDKNVIDYEPKISLTDSKDGMTFYKRYAKIFPDLLTKNGFFALEFGDEMHTMIYELFSDNFLLELINDFAGKPRFIIGSFKNN